eukprot:12741110-Prorocentrum_lima.AAC.1
MTWARQPQLRLAAEPMSLEEEIIARQLKSQVDVVAKPRRPIAEATCLSPGERMSDASRFEVVSSNPAQVVRPRG